MVAPADVLFLFDVDNTLLNNDAVADDLKTHLVHAVGAESQKRYWEIFEQLRRELGYADYLGALQRYRVERPRDPHLLRLSLFLLRYPFADRLYPQALTVVARLRRIAGVAILSDGDVVFQPWKVERSGLWQAFEGNVLIYIHKEQMLEDVEHRFPARHYVMVDDKLRILTTMKAFWRERLTTVFVRQGHYATDPAHVAGFPAADVSINAIGELSDYEWESFGLP
jgi:FMN phosphatase YigB (HAD superfamily)